VALSATPEFLCKHAIKLRTLFSGLPLGSLAIALRTKIMALQAATVEILVEKAKFDPQVALGIAEAIELAMTQAQFVTVPILDARLHEVRAEIRVLDGKLDASAREHKADMQRLSAELDAKLNAQSGKTDTQFAKIETKLAQMEAKLVRWVFLIMLGNVALSLAASTVLNAFQDFVGAAGTGCLESGAPPVSYDSSASSFGFRFAGLREP
jgi:hypothetical protein